MVAQPEPRIFISYARKDAADLAHRLRGDLESRGFKVWLDTREIRGGATWTKEIEQALDNCDVLLALLTTGSYVSEICRAEQLRALRYQKCVIPLRAQNGAEIIPLHLETKNYRDFTTPYKSAFTALLTDIGEGRGVELKTEYRETYVTAPPMPPNYIERPETLQALREAIITEGGGRNIAVTALKGMGGIGKSVLAAALCHDDVVQQAFPDGIVWVNAGKESTYDLVTRMREVGKALEPHNLARYDNDLGCKNQYRNVMRKKAALVVVDDVWDARDLEPFRVESPRSRLLFTTRIAEIAAAVGAQEHSVNFLTPEQSRELLGTASAIPEAQFPPPAADLIRECGRLPLAIGMIGAMLRGKPRTYWSRILDHLRHADLEKIKAQFPDYPHTDLLRAIQVSVDELDETARSRYFALAVLLDDMPVYPILQQTVWNVDAAEAEETAERFISLSLAQRDGEGFRLHDLQLDFVRGQFADKLALTLIHDALRLSSHVLASEPSQFASQMVGRLLSHQGKPVICDFASTLSAGAPRPWLQPLWPALDPPGTGLLRTLTGHSDWVMGVAIAPDGRLAVSASGDSTLKVWDLENGRELRTLEGHSAAVNSVAVTPDGQCVVAVSHDKTLKVWDLESGREMRTLHGHSDCVHSVAIAPNGKHAVSASGDRTLKVWDLESGRELRTLEGHSSTVHSVAIAPDGGRAVSASWDKTLKVWDLNSGCELRALTGHTDQINGVTVTPDGERAVSASNDRTLKIWHLESGVELRTLQGHAGGVYSVAIAPDGRRAVSASWDKTLKVWNLESGDELRTFQGHSKLINGVAIDRHGRFAVSASDDNTVKVWNLENGNELHKLERHSDGVNGVAAAPDGRLAVSASWDKTLKVWNLESGDELRTLHGHSDWVHSVTIAPDGKRAISASEDHTLKIWDLESGLELCTLEGHSGTVHSVAITPDGRRAVSASWDNTLKVWDLGSGFELRTLAGHSDHVHSVAITPDGRAVSASYDKTLKVWDLESGGVLRTLAGHSDWVHSVAIASDGKHAVSASGDATLKVWDLESGRELRTVEAHSDAVLGVAVSPNGRLAVSASCDSTLKVWDLATGKPLATFNCDATAECCAFADNYIVIAGDSRGRVHLLALEFPQPR